MGRGRPGEEDTQTMKLIPVLAASSLLVGAAGLAGCHSAAQAFGVAKVTPDEFRVVTKAPLVGEF